MSARISIEAPASFLDAMRNLLSVPDSVRSAMEEALAEELILLEEDLRGPSKDSPVQGGPSGPHPLSPGEGLVPINTGRLLQSFDAVPTGLSAVMTADAQSPRDGYFYASVTHHAGGADGDTVALVTQRWEAMGASAAAAMQEILTAHLEGS